VLGRSRRRKTGTLAGDRNGRRDGGLNQQPRLLQAGGISPRRRRGECVTRVLHGRRKMGHHGIFRSTNDPEGVKKLRTLGEARRRRSARRRGRRTTGEAESLGGRHSGSIQLQHGLLPFPNQEEVSFRTFLASKSTNSQKNHSKFFRFLPSA